MLQKVTCKHCQVCAARMYGGSVSLHVREYRPGIKPLYAMKQQRVLAGVRFALFVGGG